MSLTLILHTLAVYKRAIFILFLTLTLAAEYKMKVLFCTNKDAARARTAGANQKSKVATPLRAVVGRALSGRPEITFTPMAMLGCFGVRLLSV